MSAAWRALGAECAILVDNGGSVGAADWSRFLWQQKGWGAIAEHPVFPGSGSYLCPRGDAALMAELSSDLPDGPTAQDVGEVRFARSSTGAFAGVFPDEPD